MHPHLDHRLRAKLRLRHFELLDVLGETLNIHHAAPRLHLSQPATSKLLQETELIYGALLFERLPRGLRATAAGAVAIRWARSLLYQMGESVTEVHLVVAGATGWVRVGATSVAIPSLMRRVLGRAQTQMPGLVVSFTEGDIDLLLPALARNALDLVISRLSIDTYHERYVVHPLYEEPVCIVARAGHPLHRNHPLVLEDVLDAPWILPPAMAPMRQQLHQVLSARGLQSPMPRIETTSLTLMAVVLQQTDMVATMPESVALLHQQQKKLAVLDVLLPIAMPPVGLVLRADTVRSPIVEAFATLVMREGAQHRDA